MTNYSAFIPLIIIYLGIAGYMVWRITKLLVNKHKRTGYNAFFHYFSFLWAFMRAIFWIVFVSEIHTSRVVFSLLFDLPQSIQYLTFALLAVYLARMVARRKWESGGWKKMLFTLYILVAVFSIIVTVTIAFLTEYATVPDGGAEDYWSVLELLGNGVLFLFLGAVFTLLAWKMRQIRRDAFRRMFLFRPAITLSVIAIIGLCFFSRSIYNFVSYANVFRIDISSSNAVLKVYMLYLLWEFLPFILLLATITGGPQAAEETQQHFPDSYEYGVFSALVAPQQTAGASAEDEYAAYGDLTNEGILEDQNIPLLRESTLPPLVTSAVHDQMGGKPQSPLLMGLPGPFGHGRTSGRKTPLPQSPTYKKPTASINAEAVARAGTDGGLGSSGGLLFSGGSRGTGLGLGGGVGVRGDAPPYLSGTGTNKLGNHMPQYNMQRGLHQGGPNRPGNRADHPTDHTAHSSHNFIRNYSSGDFGALKGNPFSMSLPQMNQMPNNVPGMQAFSPMVGSRSHNNLPGHATGRDTAGSNNAHAYSHSGYAASQYPHKSYRDHM